MYVKMVCFTLAAWFVGLLLDANLDFSPLGFLNLRTLFPVLTVGLCILSCLPGPKTNKSSSDEDESENTTRES